jgi:hypothetical protein
MQKSPAVVATAAGLVTAGDIDLLRVGERPPVPITTTRPQERPLLNPGIRDPNTTCGHI